VASGLRRLDGVADVEVDLQANVCTVTPSRDRLLDRAALPTAVQAAGYRPARMWIEANGDLAADGRRFTIAGSEVTFAVDGAVIAAGAVIGRVEFDGTPTLHVEPAPR
jgi:copper chaperone CopZ